MKRYLYTLISLSAAIPVSASEIHYTATTGEGNTLKETNAQINKGLINIQPKEVTGGDKPWELSVYMSVEAIMNYVQKNGKTEGSVDLFSITDDPIHGTEVVDDTPLIPLMVGATVYIQWAQEAEGAYKYTVHIKDEVIGSKVESVHNDFLAEFTSGDLTTATPTLSVSLSGKNISGPEGEDDSGIITIEGVTLGTGGAIGEDKYESSITLSEGTTTFEIVADTTRSVSEVVTYKYYEDDGNETTVTNVELKNKDFLFPDAIVVATPETSGEEVVPFDLDEGTPINPTPTTSVPEPATATLSLLALAGLAARRRRR